jgi:FtsP/CotA-like multicopper oxidase with cupredoxin domain
MRKRSTNDALIAAFLITLCAGVASGSGARVTASGDQGETFREPAVVASRKGALSATLTAGESPVNIGNQRVSAAVYNGSYLPPTLRARPGDVMRLRLVNRLGDPTNLHLHGLAVSPLGNSDNVFLHLSPAGAQDYEIRISLNQAPGLYWYHPHPHGHSDDQVRNGMSGALIVEGLLDPFPTLRGVKERLLLLKDVQIEHGRVVHLGIGAHAVRTVNGLINPTIVLHPGETELWRIGNVGADLYYQLTLDGLPLYEVARDGHRVSRLVPKRELLLEPGAREEVLVQAPGPGTYTLRTAAFDTGPEGNRYPGATLATVRVEGAALPPLALPEQLLPVADLRRHITGRRTIVFSEADDGDTFFVDGRTFDPSRTDTRVQLGAVEEWTIRNESAELHDFHIHQTHFQVTEVNDVPQPFVGYQDIVNLPVHGAVKVVIPFTDPVIVGKFVYHCHLLSHEDRGMMATIVVTP